MNAFESKVYGKYISSHFGTVHADITRSLRTRYYYWKSYLTRYLPDDRNAVILEIGCGMGHNLYALSALGYANVIGYDISGECRSYCSKSGYTVSRSHSTASLAREFKHKPIALIIIYDLIEHMDPEQATKFMGEIRSLCTNGITQVLLSHPNGEFPLNSPSRYIDISHRFLYTGSSMRQLLGIAGFRAISIRSYPSFSIEDDEFGRRMAKRFILQPSSRIAIGTLRMYLAALGIGLEQPYPQLFCLAEPIQ